MVYHISKRFLQKTKNLTLKFGYFHFSLSPSTSLTTFSMPIFVSAEPSWTILLINRSEPIFKVILSKTMKISAFFVNFQLNQIQNCYVQTKKMKNGIFSFQLKKKKYLCQLTEDDRHKDVPLPFDLTRILKSYHIKGMIEENSKKNWSNRYHMR